MYLVKRTIILYWKLKGEQNIKTLSSEHPPPAGATNLQVRQKKSPKMVPHKMPVPAAPLGVSVSQLKHASLKCTTLNVSITQNRQTQSQIESGPGRDEEIFLFKFYCGKKSYIACNKQKTATSVARFGTIGLNNLQLKWWR